MTTELRLLRYFVAVAEELNFTRAAERLFIAQPSLSAAIRQLERQLGVTLFERDTRRVELTRSGGALLPHAREALDAAERGVGAAQAAQRGDVDALRVLYTTPLEPIALDAFDRLEAGEAAVAVVARGVWAPELLQELRMARTDAGLIRFPDSTDGIEVIDLGGEPPSALLSERHPLSGRSTVTLAELVGTPIIVWARELAAHGYNEYVAGLCRAGGLEHTGYATRRFDVPGWSPVVRNEAMGVIGSSERTPGGTRAVPIDGAGLMPILLAYRRATEPELLDDLASAVRIAIAAQSAWARHPSSKRSSCSSFASSPPIGEAV